MIRFETVTKTYDRTSRPALDAVSLDVERGEFVFLVGASGSGKSTFLRLVLREEVATRGAVLVAGRDVARMSSWKVPHLRRQLGVVFQDFRLLPGKTVFENVAFALQVIGRGRHHVAQVVPETLELVGLAGKEDRRPHELSGGEQQRVAIARAFVNRPAILLADEPTGNLDPGTSEGIMRLLERINRTGTTIVMATHDTSIVDALRKRVVQLDSGVVVRDEQAGTYGARGPAEQPVRPSDAGAADVPDPALVAAWDERPGRRSSGWPAQHAAQQPAQHAARQAAQQPAWWAEEQR